MKTDAQPRTLTLALESLARTTGQGAVYHGLRDGTVLMNRNVCAFCLNCLNSPGTAPFCRYSACNATMQAMSSGEPYFYRCWAGLLFVTVPVAPQNQCTGGISIGGFYAPGEEGEIRENITQRLSALPHANLKDLLARLRSLRRITPSALRGLGLLVLETTFSSGLNSSAFLKQQNERYLQQRRIAEAYADLRARDVSPPDILGDTYQLASFLHRNNRQGAMEFVSRYLAKLLMASNWDLAKLKAHVRVLLAVMTSQDVLRGTPWAAATSRELRHMLRLENAATTEESCYQVAEWIQQYFSGPAPAQPEGLSLPDRTRQWLQSHYQEGATLAAASRAVGASVSTLVHQLKRKTGKTFKALLLEIRVAEAKKLLATTSLEISDIADRCGFFDQSHFTRAFKDAINLTPGQFRRLLNMPEETLRG
jgi:AraC-like DNA-binding protein/ligand-binding sensor protein